MLPTGAKSQSSPTSCRREWGLLLRVSWPALERRLWPPFPEILLPSELFIYFILYSMQTLLSLTSLLLLFWTTLGQCDPNCLLCMKPPHCTLCLPSFALTLSGGCTPKSISNCRVYASASKCQICQSTFKMVNGACEKDTSGCLVRSAQGHCLYCGFGTVLKGLNCSGVLNCEKTGSNGVCNQCLRGYVLQMGNCVENRSECILQSAGVCSNCRRGYILNGFSCLPSTMVPPNCQLFDGLKGYCLVCNQGYQMQNRYCQRMDKLTPLGVPNQNAQNNAIKMPTDVLGGSPPSASAASRRVGNDNLLPPSYDITIFTFSSKITKPIPADPCWLRGADGQCSVCKEGYNLYKGQCNKLPPACLRYSADKSKCIECDPQLVLQNGACVDINCAIGIFSRCQVCKIAAFKANAQGICINDGCSQLVGGNCQKCAGGLVLDSNFMCVSGQLPSTNTSTNANANTNSNTNTNANVNASQNQNGQNTVQPAQSANSNQQPSSSIRNCQTEQNGRCVSCVSGYFSDGQGGCKRVVIGCLRMDPNQQNCLQCIAGYTLDSTGGCLFPSATPSPNPAPAVVQPSQPPPQPQVPKVPTDPFPLSTNCLVQNKGSCAVCNQNYILNIQNFTCEQVSPTCATFNVSDGQCLTCKFSFNMFRGWCLPRMNSTDPNCQISDINNYCVKCQTAFYSDQGRCKSNNALCQSIEYRGGRCLSCYGGYILFNGGCYEISKQPACRTYNFQAICSECWNRFYLLAGVCYPVSPLCVNYNATSGQCVDCIQGYGLSSSTLECIQVKPIPPNCARADQAGKCLACVSRYYLDAKGECSPVAPLCQNFNQIGGKCQKCFPGYNIMADSSCLKQSLAVGCISATQEGVCSMCLAQYVLSLKGECVTRDLNCVLYEGATCTKCKMLYYLSKGKCIKETPKDKDPNCRINDLYNYCQQCNPGYYVFEGNCNLVDQLCRTYKQTNGDCLSCYDGYRLNNGRCYLNSPIFNCQIFKGIVCQQCEPGYKLQPDGSCIL